MNNYLIPDTMSGKGMNNYLVAQIISTFNPEVVLYNLRYNRKRWYKPVGQVYEKEFIYKLESSLNKTKPYGLGYILNLIIPYRVKPLGYIYLTTNRLDIMCKCLTTHKYVHTSNLLLAG
jgi:hypothetical protein